MHAMAIYLDGTDAPDEDADGAPLLDDDFLILVNAAWWEPVSFTIPPVRETTQTWFIELDSYDPAVSPAREFPRHTGDQVVARPRSLSVLRAPRPDKDETALTRTVPCFAWSAKI
jgi:glycogen operon protein